MINKNFSNYSKEALPEKVLREHDGPNRKEQRWGMMHAFRMPGKKAQTHMSRQTARHFLWEKLTPKKA